MLLSVRIFESITSPLAIAHHKPVSRKFSKLFGFVIRTLVMSHESEHQCLVLLELIAAQSSSVRKQFQVFLCIWMVFPSADLTVPVRLRRSAEDEILAAMASGIALKLPNYETTPDTPKIKLPTVPFQFQRLALSS
jgi:hypothetical protein